MVDKLDQSLDSIMTERRKTNRRVRNPRRAITGAKPAAAPVGGIKKTTKPVNKPAEKVVPVKPANGDSKIIVSNLPHDVSETQIKDYFTQTVGAVKKVLLSYGPNGQSRGVATITFNRVDAASQAAKDLDGLKVDNRPMKIEVILGAKDAPTPAPPKSLSDRIASKPKTAAAKAKAQPKPATAAKANGASSADKKGAVGKKGSARRGRVGRGKPKTAEELDAEMADYWDAGANGAVGGAATAAVTNGGAVQPTAAGEVAMDDGIM